MKLPAPKKHLGQHFLKDQSVILAITDNFKDQAEVIVEVGPGPGILTEKLNQSQLPLFLLEADREMAPYLSTYVAQENIFWGDAVHFDWIQFISTQKILNSKIWVVSNLPYNASVPLLISFMKIPEVQFMTLMFQREVAQKIFPTQTKKILSSLFCLCHNYFYISQLKKVAPGAFHPPPMVHSTVLSFERREDCDIALAQFEHYEDFLKKIFKQPRKQLGGVLKSMNYQRFPEILNDLNISAQVRAQDLKVENINALYNCWT